MVSSVFFWLFLLNILLLARDAIKLVLAITFSFVMLEKRPYLFSCFVY